ncbi:LlaJI family restriction endonuclease [Rouxiella badensis]|uniref:LlaJI family restriction endonuclease n=1 Tax=Rouxiella badensis TaxID=1646377 RepID=UPI0013EF106C|nr:LlaJI family restriction endonuclease [Rouxiella badensis]QII37380.1 LlaJI family restriction endonuclease [Rouxiella badensis]
MNINLHEDRCLVSSLPEQVLTVLYSENLLGNDQYKLDFCGMVMQDNRVDIFLPRNSGTISHLDQQKTSASLIRAIHKYTQNKDRSLFSEGASERLVGDSFLALAFTLFSDYVEHGIYFRKTTDIRKNTGKIDWKRTIGKIQGYPSNGVLAYLDTLGRKNLIHYDDEVTRIHAEIIREIDRIVGWVFSDENLDITSELAYIKKPSGDVKTKIGVLERELAGVFSDRKIKLMIDLVAYLTNKTGRSDNSLVIGISKFHSMWEHMIDSCMKWKYDINRRLAKPCYKINGEYQIAAQKGGRTDTVLRSPDKSIFSIIDAKYYGAENLANLPGWPDLIKQFFYALALKDIYPEATIHNWFIFPGASQKVDSVHLMSPTTRELQDEKYTPILCEYLDPISLINCYLSGKTLLDLPEKLLQMQKD